jgi:hypothetical protein
MALLGKDNKKGIIWLASYPRSGNTWTRAFLHSLAAVMRDPDVDEIDINRIEEGSVVENAAALFPRFLNKPVALASQAEVARARPWVQAALVESATGRTMYVKTHNANALDHGTPLINMGVSLGAIYLVRNPLDVVISYAHLNGTDIDTMIEMMATPGFGIGRSSVNGLDRVHVVIGSWSENVASWTQPPHPAVLVIRYEDLLANPEAGFLKVTRHLQIKPTRAELRRAIELSRFDRLRGLEARDGFAERPQRSSEAFFREGRAGQWRERLSEAQVARIVELHGPLMKRFGYLPDAAGASRPQNRDQKRKRA